MTDELSEAKALIKERDAIIKDLIDRLSTSDTRAHNTLLASKNVTAELSDLLTTLRNGGPRPDKGSLKERLRSVRALQDAIEDELQQAQVFKETNQQLRAGCGLE